MLQYEALVDPAAGLAHYTQSEFDYEEGQSPAHTYFWMTTLANLGTPTSAIRGDYALSAVFAQEGLVTYAAHNPTAETIDVHFSDGTYAAGRTLLLCNHHLVGVARWAADRSAGQRPSRPRQWHPRPWRI